MNHKIERVIGIGLVLLFLGGCGGPAAPIPPTPTPVLPEIGVPLSAGNGLTVTVIEYTTLPEVSFLDETEMQKSSSGNTYQAVAIEMKLDSGTYTTMLNLDSVILITEDSKSISPFTLTLGPSPDHKISDVAFYKGVGEDGKTLDFGMGFSGLDLA